ncbi:hypothetical protein ACWFRX_10550 [Streptomyces sp. NPDC055100]|uniref:hypothetical protein n=1 Tax=Streptomyces sp. NPDC127532 TaxID=3345399 RepID=UPI0036304F2C
MTTAKAVPEGLTTSVNCHWSEGTLIRLKVEHLSKERDAPPEWSWSSKTGGTADEADRL